MCVMGGGEGKVVRVGYLCRTHKHIVRDQWDIHHPAMSSATLSPGLMGIFVSEVSFFKGIKERREIIRRAVVVAQCIHHDGS